MLEEIILKIHFVGDLKGWEWLEEIGDKDNYTKSQNNNVSTVMYFVVSKMSF